MKYDAANVLTTLRHFRETGLKLVRTVTVTTNDNITMKPLAFRHSIIVTLGRFSCGETGTDVRSTWDYNTVFLVTFDARTVGSGARGC